MGYIEFRTVECNAICMVEGGLSEEAANSPANGEAMRRNDALVQELHHMGPTMTKAWPKLVSTAHEKGNAAG